MSFRRPKGQPGLRLPRREARAEVKLLAFAGTVVSVAAGVVGTALGGFLGTSVFLVALVAILFLSSHLFSPPPRVEEGQGRKADEIAYLGKLVLLGFVLRVLVSGLIHMFDWWKYLGGDEETFARNGHVFALWLKGVLPFRLSGRFQETHEVGYFYLVGGLYYTFGVTKVIPLLLNCLLGASLAYPVHALAGRFAGRIAARRAATLVVFFPSLVLWSSLMVRDVMVLFFLASALLAADHLRRAFTPGQLFLLFLSLGALITLRTYIFLIVAVALVVSLFLAPKSPGRSLFVGGALMVVLVALTRGAGVGEAEMGRANLDYLNMMRGYNALGPSVAGSLGDNVDISTPTKALTYLPVGLLYFYFSPLPWQIGSPRQVLAITDLVVWYAMMPAIFTGIAWMFRSRFRAGLPLLFAVIGISVLYALVEGNIGIIFRHRAQIIVPLCVMAGVGYARRQRARAKERNLLASGFSHHPPEGSALRPAPGVRLPSGA